MAQETRKPRQISRGFSFWLPGDIIGGVFLAKGQEEQEGQASHEDG
jgi:hypothetical protein